MAATPVAGQGVLIEGQPVGQVCGVGGGGAGELIPGMGGGVGGGTRGCLSPREARPPF